MNIFLYIMKDHNEERDFQILLTLLIKQNINLPSIEKLKNDTEYIFYIYQNEKYKYINNYNYINSIKNGIKNKDIKDIIISMMLLINFVLDKLLEKSRLYHYYLC